MSSLFLTRIVVILYAALCAYAQKTTVSPELNYRTCEVVKSHGYPCEIHEVTTEDHYIVELHRIPHGITTNTTGTRAVFLQHGILDSSYTWVMNPPYQSLAYLLANQGYDVWMGNSRGNTYSWKHTLVTQDSDEYWNFSFDEMAKYDLPASIDFVLKTSGLTEVSYIGHSQGTTIGFAAFSRSKKLSEKIKMFIALAPIAHVAHVQGLLKFLSYSTPIGKQVASLLGIRSFLPSSWVTKTIAKLVCGSTAQALCGSVLFLITGFDFVNLDMKRLPIMLSHNPAGTSVKDIEHYRQMMDSDKFQMYDYGWNGNMHTYMQPTPPEYFVSDVTVPVALFSGDNDWLATPADIAANLRYRLRNKVYDQQDKNWNNLDFVWGKYANSVIYENIMTVLDGGTP